MTPTFFPDQDSFRSWLDQNHNKETELLVGYYKVGTGKPSMTWSQSVDQALCFGWIDGVRRSIDRESYCIRFTPRKANSIWSTVNINKVEELTKKGLMHEAGLASFARRKENKSGIYSYEKATVEFSEEVIHQLKANQEAWKYFIKQAPSYQKRIKDWIMSAKQPATLQNRIQRLISSCEAGERL